MIGPSAKSALKFAPSLAFFPCISVFLPACYRSRPVCGLGEASGTALPYSYFLFLFISFVVKLRPLHSESATLPTYFPRGGNHRNANKCAGIPTNPLPV